MYDYSESADKVLDVFLLWIDEVVTNHTTIGGYPLNAYNWLDYITAMRLWLM